MSLLHTYLNKIFGDPNEKAVKKLKPIVLKINQLEKRIQSLSDEKLKNQTAKFKKLLSEGKTLDEILPEAFATVREASRRTLGERPFDEQIMGGIVLHQGKISEMKTGEGKTLTSTMPIYLNALAGKGVHVVTVNDYLARRDTNWMGAVFYALGVSTACIQHARSFLFEPKVKPDEDEVSVEYQNLREISRKEAYSADITYGTNNEFGFDYLRDNMVQDISEMVQMREGSDSNAHLNYAIVDEVDSILIDESRTPLIISAPDEESTKLYQKFALIMPRLLPEKHYTVDEKMRAVTLTEEGMKSIEKILDMGNIYRDESISYVHHLQQALKAHALFKKDKDYVVKDGQVLIVDEFTGRIMPGRRFSEGLHQALEAKEGVNVQRESKTLATITFQNYFRLYKKLAGMTGTAMTSAEEFSKVYKLEIVSIPTHRKMVRKDLGDRVYKTEAGKFQAVTRSVKKRYKKGQPVLIGTIAIEKSEIISQYLEREGIKHEILNAKNHEREAQIIAKAGEKGQVTIATNMAGRGTDIKLGQGVKELGGLHILGTERHEARRIDDQLRGRAGRQGDPGSSQFFVSMEDELMRRFGSDRVKNMMDTLGIPDDEPIENKMISRSIEKAQAKIEGHNFDIRKHVLDYDDVMNKQREIIYGRRKNILIQKEDLKEKVKSATKSILGRIINFHSASLKENGDWNLEEMIENFITSFSLKEGKESITSKIEEIYQKDEFSDEDKKRKIRKIVFSFLLDLYEKKEEIIGQEQMRQVERMFLLRITDLLWMEHLENMQYLREGIGLRGYGQRDPLVEYKQEGFRIFEKLLNNIEEDWLLTLFKIEPQRKTEESETNQSINSGLKKRLASASYEKPEEPGGFSSEETTEKPKTNQVATVKKVGRNEPCPCGSGKKYKRCCGK